jgi:hypothetical protein
MKTKVNLISGLLTMAMAFVITATAFAKGDGTGTFTQGTTDTPAGDYVVSYSQELYYFQGDTYEVYQVSYEDPSMNFKLAVNKTGRCKSFIAYNDDYSLFYKCDENGFGVRKVMFKNRTCSENFDPVVYQAQSQLNEEQRIDKKDAVDIIASSLPKLQKS